MQVLCRGTFGMDAKRGTMGQGWPTVTTLGTVPERGKFRAAKPGCRVRFLFGYFLFRASKEKVTRRKAETGSGGKRNRSLALQKNNRRQSVVVLFLSSFLRYLLS